TVILPIGRRDHFRPRLLAVLFFCSVLPAAARADQLLFYNGLGSAYEITHSFVGPNGNIVPGTSLSFVPGSPGDPLGSALLTNHATAAKVSFPKEAINPAIGPHLTGRLEFWAKLSGFPSGINWGGHPIFVQIQDGTSTFDVELNGNDGAGNGGLTGRAGG